MRTRSRLRLVPLCLRALWPCLLVGWGLGCTDGSSESGAMDASVSPEPDAAPADAGVDGNAAPGPDADAAPGPSDNGWLDTAGLLWPDGVEPGAADDCEATAPSRCWWVDAAAPDGGDGGYATPFNSFEQVVGSMSNNSYVQGSIQGGDHLYVTGTFQPAASPSPETLKIHMARGNQAGTLADPTVIKSWKGRPRAVFDGEHLERNLISIGGGTTPYEGVVIQNLEIWRAEGRGIHIGERVGNIEVVSVYFHDTLADGNVGTGGAILFGLTSSLHTYSIHNCLFDSNDVGQFGGANNRGALGILSESTADPQSKITVYENVLRNEFHAVRHKHSGDVLMEAYHNVIYDSESAFYLRTARAEVHHNVIYRVGTAFRIWDENRQADSEQWIGHNTVGESASLLVVLSDDPAYTRAVHLTDNLYTARSDSDGVLVLGRWGSEYGVSIDGWTFANNLYDLAAGGDSVLYHKEIGVDGTPDALAFSDAMTHLGDTTSFSAAAGFVDVAAADYRLDPTSPARGAASDGSDIGALSYEGR